MKTIFIIIILSLSSCSSNEFDIPNCEDVKGTEFKDWDDIPPNYNGIIKICNKKGLITAFGKLETGLRSGKWQEYGKISLKETSHFIKGEYDGKFISYHDNGELKIESHYSNGSLEGNYISYFDNGQIHVESSYSNGRIEGGNISYFENGQIHVKSKYSKGYLEGKYISNFENGSNCLKCNYLHGKLHGNCFYFNKNSKLIKTEFYSFGVLKFCKGNCGYDVPEQYK